MTDVQRPPTLTLRSRTGAAKPILWPTLNPCHFTVPCFIFKTKTFSFSSKQALSNDVLSVKIGRTTTLRRLFKVINFGRSKFVCTPWPCPVFGMRAAGLATHLTTPVCPVARTQTIILQVVYCRGSHSQGYLQFYCLYGSCVWLSHGIPEAFGFRKISSSLWFPKHAELHHRPVFVAVRNEKHEKASSTAERRCYVKERR